MAKLKLEFELSREVGSSNFKLTEENYSGLSKGQKILVNLAESMGIEPRLGQFDERFFVSNDTLDTIISKIEQAK